MTFRRKPLPVGSVVDPKLRTVFNSIEHNLEGLEQLVRAMVPVVPARTLTLCFTSLGQSGSFTFAPINGFHVPVAGRVVASSVRATFTAVGTPGTMSVLVDNGVDPALQIADLAVTGVGSFDARATFDPARSLAASDILAVLSIWGGGLSGTMQDAACVLLIEEA